MAEMTDQNRTPKHIAIILDGNRRFAKRLMLKPWMGHEWGKKKVRSLIEWASELGIEELTLYAFSVENFNRPKGEFNYIMKLFMESCEELKSDKDIQRVRINFLGRLGMFPEAIQKLMKELMEKTKGNKGVIVNFCMAYGGRQELADAARRMASDVESGKISSRDINDDTLKNYLYLSSDPDIIIRTGGEKRLSGFLLYQSSYSELFFLGKMWPEFEKEDLLQVIDEFRQRERRFGR